MTPAEKKLAIDSLVVRRAMNQDCFNLTTGPRQEHYQECLAKIDAELAELTGKNVVEAIQQVFYIIDNEPLNYRTEEEHKRLESFANRCIAKISKYFGVKYREENYD